MDNKNRMFELIEKYIDTHKPLIFRMINKIAKKTKPLTREELYELSTILINHNPYFESSSINVKFSNNKNKKVVASYNHSFDRISIYNHYAELITKGKVSFCHFLDTLEHEKRHLNQHLALDGTITASYEQKVLEELQNREAFNVKHLNIISNYLNNEKYILCHPFGRHNIYKEDGSFELKKSYQKILNCEYFGRSYEIDARSYAEKQVYNFFTKVILDPDCPPALKEKLGKDIRIYSQVINPKQNKEAEYAMTYFLKFKLKLINKIKKVIENQNSDKYFIKKYNTLTLIKYCANVLVDTLSFEDKKLFLDFYSNYTQEYELEHLYLTLEKSLKSNEERKIFASIMEKLRFKFNNENNKTIT